jgi:hypothetical protein
VSDESSRVAERVACTEPFNLEFEYELAQEITGLRVGLYLSTSRGEPVLTSFDTDDPQAFVRHTARPAGRYISRCRIPAGLLNEGLFVAGVNASSFRIRSYFTDEHALSFSVDGTGAPGSHWPEPRGPIRPALAWEITEVSAMTDGGARRRSSARWANCPWRQRPIRCCAGKASRHRVRLDRPQAAPAGMGARRRAGRPAESAIRRSPAARGRWAEWWIEYAAALALLTAAGHRVDWPARPPPLDGADRRFRLRRQWSLPARRALRLAGHSPARPTRRPDHTPCRAGNSLQALDRIDVRYTRQREALDLDPGGQDQSLLELRRRRNRQRRQDARLLGRRLRWS